MPTFTLDDVASVIAEAVQSATAPLLARIAELESKAAIPGPPGPPGKDGRDGIDGLAGKDGRDGAPGAPGEAGAQGPAGEMGAKGIDGLAGRDGRDGLPGVPGAPGEKGLDGKDGLDGLDGKDGLGFDDLDVTHDGERAITVSLVRGDQRKTFGPFVFPVQIYRGVYRPEKSYVYQDVTTWAGSEWVCMAAAPTGKPGLPDSGWVLAVKHGRDGKDGAPGAKGLDGRNGKDGRFA